MARPTPPEDDQIIESWEAVTPGTTWVWTFDRREDRYTKTRVGGRSGSKRLHISRDDRRFNQEQVVDENKHLDPFTNGALRLIDAASRDETLETRYHLTDDDLLAMLADRDDEAGFTARVDSITSELVIRRLAALAEKHASMWQLEHIKNLIETRYKVGGTQRTVAELLAAGDRVGATAL